MVFDDEPVRPESALSQSIPPGYHPLGNRQGSAVSSSHSHIQPPLRYYRDELPKRVASSRVLSSYKFNEKVYGMKIAQNLKEREFLEFISGKKYKRILERRKEKAMVEKKLKKIRKTKKSKNREIVLRQKFKKEVAKLGKQLIIQSKIQKKRAIVRKKRQ